MVKERVSDKVAVGEADKDMLYGLYKKATVGRAPNRSLSWSTKAKKKSNAWKKLDDIPEDTLEEAFKHLHQALDILKLNQDSRTAAESSDFIRSPLRRPSKLPKGKLPPTAEEPSSSSSEGETAEVSEVSPEENLLVAAGEDDYDTVKALLDKGAAIDHGDECGQTALHMAADHGAERTLKLLIERGAAVSSTDQHGVSVLQAAVIAGHVNVAKILLEHGADPDQQDEDGDSPHMCAMDDGSPEMQELFDDGEEESDNFDQESNISWDTEFTIDQLKSPHKIIDHIPSILDK